ncbi:MAG TPA: helix-turn-helix transcriptional regulator [Tepidiformaceae bacterium]|nr:helix-turn-helix transcriptional regulator [Tepidiformaceae bacterium]
MRRKPGTLIPIELAILSAAIDLRTGGEDEFHGYAIARSMRGDDAGRQLTGYGTLYRALERLETAGLLESRWEDPELAFAEDRPRRRLYHITALGQEAAVNAAVPVVRANTTTNRGLAPS